MSSPCCCCLHLREQAQEVTISELRSQLEEKQSAAEAETAVIAADVTKRDAGAEEEGGPAPSKEEVSALESEVLRLKAVVREMEEEEECLRREVEVQRQDFQGKIVLLEARLQEEKEHAKWNLGRNEALVQELTDLRDSLHSARAESSRQRAEYEAKIEGLESKIRRMVRAQQTQEVCPLCEDLLPRLGS